MLMISPNERMTIQELVQHPWLNSGIAPETVLQSPQYMMDQVCKFVYAMMSQLMYFSKIFV